MKLSREQVKKVAKLANLNIPDADLEKYSDQLSKILDYVDQLNQVDTKNVEPLFNVSGKDSVEREDQVEDSLSQSDTLSNASAKNEDFFRTKGVFADE